MKKLIYIALICVSVLALVSVTRYMGDNTSKAPGYHSEVILTLFSMKTSSDFVIKLPDTDAGVKLTSIIGLGTQQGKAQGDYQIDEERGEVLLDYMLINVLGPMTADNKMYFVAPFTISNQGSGVFTYVGLFEQNFDNQTIQHLDSYFIGDRVQLNEMRLFDSKIELSFNQHGEQQAYAEAPTETVNLTLGVDDVIPTKLVKQ
ncbi:hypothetical protein [Moritella sp. Urea-trap-13]|uniref:hypothetical protein n=1 Tax=Moritella sp. Urea-trap-13 TaxID=2058327 RepID=UPI000C32A7DE|nr:hypothetical protein [Moritella sp. Urea-trap-13]PKH07863.1 hypothetical protein CXF93_03990 [Moritella sp. Urea-trap-13]